MSTDAKTTFTSAGITYKNIGSGSFGCVYSPALPYDAANDIEIIDVDDNPKKINTVLVSKIGETKEMSKELDLYDGIYKVDPDYKYHYPKPILIKINPFNWKHLIKPLLESTCERVYPSYGTTINDYRILEMNYGGKDLYFLIRAIVNNMNIEFTTRSPYTFERHKVHIANTIKILKHFHHMFQGVRAFLAPSTFEDKFLHNDIKSMNIVYNDDASTGTPQYMKYIDLGLSANFSEFFKDDKKFDGTHATFPPETVLLDKVNFDMLKQFAAHKSAEGGDREFDTIIMNACVKVFSDKNGWYRNFFLHSGLLELKTPEELAQLKRKHFADFKACFLRIATEESIQYKDFVRLYFEKRDVYGLGYTLLELMKKIQLVYSGYTSKEFHDKMRGFIELAENLTHFNIFERLSIETADTTYDELLQSCMRDFLVEIAWQETGEMKGQLITERDYELTRSLKRKRTGGEVVSSMSATTSLFQPMRKLSKVKSKAKPDVLVSPKFDIVVEKMEPNPNVLPELGTNEFDALLKIHDKYYELEQKQSDAIKRRMRQKKLNMKNSSIFGKLSRGGGAGNKTRRVRRRRRQQKRSRTLRKK